MAFTGPVSYSGGMTDITNVQAEDMSPPSIPIPGYPTGYPNPNRKLGKAWAHAWAELAALGPEDYLDGTELAQRAAKKAGLEPITIVSLLTRAATAGKLERTHRTVPTEKRGPRKRTFYRTAA